MPRSIVLAIVVTASLGSSAFAQTAAFFDDSTDVILVDGQTTIGNTATYEAILLFPSDTSANGNVFNEWAGFQEDKVLRSGPSFTFGYNYNVGSATGTGIVLMPDVWHHIAFVLDAGGSRLYVDGDLIATGGTTGNVSDGAGQPNLGAIFRDGALVNSFIGYIEALRISDVARYEGERFDPPYADFESDANTQLLFNFSEPAGSPTVADSGPQGLTGTLGAGFDGASEPVLGAEVPTLHCPAAHITSDLWDVSRNTILTATSGYSQGNADHGENMFGGSAASPEAGTSFFRDDVGDGFVHYVEWQTSSAVTARGIAVHAASDYPNHNDRDFSTFRLFGFDETQGEFVELTSYDAPSPYGGGTFGNHLLVCQDVPAMTTDRFRAEFVQRGAGTWSGPRIYEIDGFGSRMGLPVTVDLIPVLSDATLYAPFPNPASERVTVPFEIRQSSHVRLEVFDLLGRRVSVLADEILAPGSHSRVLDAAVLPRGLYFVRLVVGPGDLVRKIVLG